MRWLLTLSLLLVIFSLIDMRAALSLFREAEWRWLLAAIALVQLQIVLSALRWQATAVRLGQPLRVSRAIGEYYLATLGNLSLPGGITGDALRVARNREQAGTALSTRTVILERAAGQLALLAVAILGLCLWPWLMGSSTGQPGAGIAIAMNAPGNVQALFWLMPGLLVVLATGGALLLWLRRVGGNRVARLLSTLIADMHRAWIADAQWLRQSSLSLGVVATYLGVFAFSAAALQQSLPLGGILAVIPLVLLSMVIPLSVGGWGIRESAAVMLWPLMGLSAESAVASSVLYGIVSTLGCLPGALFALAPAQR